MIPVLLSPRDVFWCSFVRVIDRKCRLDWVERVWDRWDADPGAMLRALEQPAQLQRGVRALSAPDMSAGGVIAFGA